MWKFSTKSSPLTLNPLSSLTMGQYHQHFEHLSQRNKFVGIKEKLPNKGIAAIILFVKFDKGILVLFHCSWEEIRKFKFCCISFPTWHCLQETRFSRMFSSIRFQDLEDSTMKFGVKKFRHLANKDCSGLFSIAWLQRLPKNSSVSFFKLKNLHASHLLTIN